MPIFDRFLRYQWAEHALDLAVQGQSAHSLRDWLSAEGLQGESARRTRPDLLSDLRALAPLIHALGGESAAAETFRAIQDVARWWP